MRLVVSVACSILASSLALASAQEQTCDEMIRNHVTAYKKAQADLDLKQTAVVTKQAALSAAQANLKKNPTDANAIKVVSDAQLTFDASARGFNDAAAELDSPTGPVGLLNDDLDWDEDTPCLVGLILKTRSGTPQQIAAAIKAAFQQNGSSSGTGGSTNLVSKGITAQILTLAGEYGALTESTTGSTVTVQGSLGGIPTALGNEGILLSCSGATPGSCIPNKTINFLNRFSYSIGFDTSQNSQSVNSTPSSTDSSSSAQLATFTASSHTLNSVTAKGVLIRAPDASAATISAAIAKLNSTSDEVKKDGDVNAARKALKQDCPQPVIKSWMTSAFFTLINADSSKPGTFAAIWFSLGPPLVSALEANPMCKTKYLVDSQAVAKNLSSYLASLNSFFEGLRAAPLLSLEYDYNSPANQPTNSTVRLIGQISKNRFTGTLNAAGSFYNSTPSASIPSASRVRDFQIAAEGSYGFGKRLESGRTNDTFLGTSTASLAYYYQDQTSPAILNVTPGQPVSGVTITGLPSTATQIYAQKGVINIAQAKFTWIPKNWNFNFPVSITWSNRTELVTSPVWRGQLGISYDFDSLFSKK
jgi:hypothetical protein